MKNKPKKVALPELNDPSPVEIERVENGYILMIGFTYNNTPEARKRLVFNNFEDLCDELKERFEEKND